MRAILEKACEIVGTGGYRPSDTDLPNSMLPQSMRKLIEDDLPDEDTQEADPWRSNEFRPQLRQFDRCPGRMMTSPTPVDGSVLDRQRPRAPHSAMYLTLDDLRQWKILAIGTWTWAKRRKKRVDIDHALTGDPEGWPIIQLFEQELHRRSGMTTYDIFGDTCDEPTFCGAYLPLYCVDCDEDYVPVVRFLEEEVSHVSKSGQVTFPEICRQSCRSHGWGEDEIARAEEVMKNILLSSRLRLLSREWRRAIMAVDKWGCGLCFWDYEQVRYELRESDFEGFFETCRRVSELLAAVNPLISLIWKDVEKFWWTFVCQLEQAAKRHPELESPVPQKVKVKI